MKKICVKAVLLAAIMLLAPSLSYAEETRVIPVGKAVGIQIYTDGLLVIGTTQVNGQDIAKKSGIKVNDRIKSANGIKTDTTEEFAKIVNESPEGVNLCIARDNREIEVNAVPELTEDDVYRLGIWVRDSCAGVGTVTYYDPANKSFAALGHSINDIDTGDVLASRTGSILSCDIVSVTKSRQGSPGEINAAFGADKMGEIYVNSPVGIFGTAYDGFWDSSDYVTVAAKEQIHEGDAYILSDIFGGNTEKYTIQIKKITNDDDKGLVLEITDERLIQSAGGIVQGMSGSPIIQDGYLVGAVTHVFVNSPQKGYGALAEKMIDTQRKSM